MKYLKVILSILVAFAMGIFAAKLMQEDTEQTLYKKNVTQETQNKLTTETELNEEREEQLVDTTKQDIDDNEKQDVEQEQVEEKEKEEKDVINENTTSSNKENDDININSLSNEKLSWSFKRNENNLKPGSYSKIDLSKYDAYYCEDTDEKVIYLTFDEGYENGYTARILDTLQENNVQAAFFVTKPYIEQNQQLIKRMVNEGHLVGNHSVKHKSFPTLTDEQVVGELQDTADYYYQITGKEMDPFFRPPMGEYSERVLYLAKKEGYKTIFWSIAYKDWDINNQPGKNYVYEHFQANHHKGAIPLVHAVSSSNTEALNDVIKSMKTIGYRFGSLYELKARSKK